MRKLPLLLAPITLLGACTYGIVLNDAGKKVHTAWNSDLSVCRDVGKVTVSVLGRIGPFDRNDIKVRDELEVMARNQAAELGADTIKPLADLEDGEQPWGAYFCGANIRPAAAPAAAKTAPAADSGAANGFQTYPIK